MNHIYSTEEQRAWHKKLPKKNVSTHVLLRYNKRILMLKPTYKNKWVFPGGVVEENESPLDAAARELKEETRIDVATSDLQFAGVSYVPPYDDFPERIAFTYIYDAQDKLDLVLQKEEIEEAEWVTIEEMSKKIGEKRAFYSTIQQKLAENSFPFYTDLTLTP